MEYSCYTCGKRRCVCEIPKVSVAAMKKRVRHAYTHGLRYDKDACTFEELAGLLKLIATFTSGRDRAVRLLREIHDYRCPCKPGDKEQCVIQKFFCISQ